MIRPKENINPLFLHFVIRLDSTLEQFRKFSTGSSYPAILNSDVAKTLIPLPNKKEQDIIANYILEKENRRKEWIESANQYFLDGVEMVTESLSKNSYMNLKE